MIGYETPGIHLDDPDVFAAKASQAVDVITNLVEIVSAFLAEVEGHTELGGSLQRIQPFITSLGENLKPIPEQVASLSRGTAAAISLFTEVAVDEVINLDGGDC